MCNSSNSSTSSMSSTTSGTCSALVSCTAAVDGTMASFWEKEDQFGLNENLGTGPLLMNKVKDECGGSGKMRDSFSLF